jgi:hypothetical protein
LAAGQKKTNIKWRGWKGTLQKHSLTTRAVMHGLTNSNGKLRTGLGAKDGDRDE